MFNEWWKSQGVSEIDAREYLAKDAWNAALYAASLECGKPVERMAGGVGARDYFEIGEAIEALKENTV
jgi:hypothetical protein